MYLSKGHGPISVNEESLWVLDGELAQGRLVSIKLTPCLKLYFTEDRFVPVDLKIWSYTVESCLFILSMQNRFVKWNFSIKYSLRKFFSPGKSLLHTFSLNESLSKAYFLIISFIQHSALCIHRLHICGSGGPTKGLEHLLSLVLGRGQCWNQSSWIPRDGCMWLSEYFCFFVNRVLTIFFKAKRYLRIFQRSFLFLTI